MEARDLFQQAKGGRVDQLKGLGCHRRIFLDDPGHFLVRHIWICHRLVQFQIDGGNRRQLLESADFPTQRVRE